jgi:hypothetical protein
MSENFSRIENETNPSNEYLREEIAKIKTELDQLKNLKEQTFQITKSTSKRKPVKKSVKRRTVTKRKPVKKSVKRRTVTKRKPVKKSVKRRTVTKRKPVKKSVKRRTVTKRKVSRRK